MKGRAQGSLVECLQEGNFREVEGWLPPLDGEEPHELKDAEEEVAGESGDDGDEESDSESPPPAVVPVVRKTCQQTVKELAKTRAAATPTGSQEASSSEQSSSSGIQELEKTPPRPRKQKSPSQVEVAKE